MTTIREIIINLYYSISYIIIEEMFHETDYQIANAFAHFVQRKYGQRVVLAEAAHLY